MPAKGDRERMASAAPQEGVVYSFGPFALDAGQRVLARDGQPLHLTPRELDILAVLVVRHGELVDKGWLLQEVWRGVCVEECNLSQHVAALRRVLEDDARQPTYIETVPRRGYRFVARVAIGAEALRVGATAPTAPVAAGPALRQEPSLQATVVPDVPPAVAPPPPEVPPAVAPRRRRPRGADPGSRSRRWRWRWRWGRPRSAPGRSSRTRRRNPACSGSGRWPSCRPPT